MGTKPAQGGLTAALKLIYAHMPDVHSIHDDLFIAAKAFNEHNLALQDVMRAI